MFKIGENLLKSIKSLITDRKLAYAAANGVYGFSESDAYGCTECAYTCEDACENATTLLDEHPIMWEKTTK